MADSNVVSIRIGASVDELKSGTQAASAHIASLRSAMLEMKAEATQTGRAARFFASDLAAVIPIADEAKGILRDLFSVALAGGGIGAAVAGVQLLVAIFKELSSEGDKAREAIQKYTDNADKSLAALKVRVDALLLSFTKLTAAQTIAATDLKVAKEAEKKAQDEVLKTELALGSARQHLADMGGKTGAAGRQFAQAAEDFNNAITKFLKARETVIGIEEEIAKVKVGEAAVEAEKKEKTEEQHNIRMLGLKAQLLDGEAKLRAEFAAKLAQIRAREDTTEKQDNQEIALEKQILDKKIAEKTAEDAAKWRAAELQEWKKHYDAITAATLRSLEEQKKEEDKAFAERKAKIEFFANHMRNAISSSVSAIVNGTKSVGDAMVEMVKRLADATIAGLANVLEKWIVNAIIGRAVAKVEAISTTQGHIAEAVAGAAASQAFIPFVGPGLAAAAAAEMFGSLEAITAPLLSAARGFDIPSGVNPIIQAHAREMVLPEDLAEGARRTFERGGGGEVHVHFHMMAGDGPSIDRFVKSSYFVSSLRDAIRQGRL